MVHQPDSLAAAHVYCSVTWCDDNHSAVAVLRCQATQRSDETDSSTAPAHVRRWEVGCAACLCTRNEARVLGRWTPPCQEYMVHREQKQQSECIHGSVLEGKAAVAGQAASLPVKAASRAGEGAVGWCCPWAVAPWRCLHLSRQPPLASSHLPKTTRQTLP